MDFHICLHLLSMYLLQCSLFITLCSGSIGMGCGLREPYDKGTVLQRNYRKMTMKWSFSYNSFVKFHGKIT